MTEKLKQTVAPAHRSHQCFPKSITPARVIHVYRIRYPHMLHGQLALGSIRVHASPQHSEGYTNTHDVNPIEYVCRNSTNYHVYTR